MFANLRRPILPRPYSSKPQPKKPSIIIPPTPVSITANNTLSQYGKSQSVQELSDTDTTTVAPSSCTTVSPSPSVEKLHDKDNQENMPPKMIGRNFVAPLASVPMPRNMPPDTLMMAEMLSAMKGMMNKMEMAIGEMSSQSQSTASIRTNKNATEQLKQIRIDLDKMMLKQQEDIRNVRALLESKVKDALENYLREEMLAMIKDSVAKQVGEAVRRELERQIPEELRVAGYTHSRQIQEVKMDLHNSEARQYNARLEPTALNIPLRPLLRPLPSPEQSPARIVRSFSFGGNSPISAIPNVPAPTPIERQRSLRVPRAGGFDYTTETISASPSPLFPKDLKDLFSLPPARAKSLLRDYGLDGGSTDSSVSTPTTTNPMPPLTIVLHAPDASQDTLHSANEECVEHDINKLMHHIGVPFKMVPNRTMFKDPLVIHTSH